MNIWQMYLIGIVVPLFWCVVDFFKYKKIASTRFDEDSYVQKHSTKSSLRLSFKNYFNNVAIVIISIATIYTIGYIFSLGFIEALPYY